MAKITMREAISQALMEEMDRDPAVFIMGEEVGVWGGTYAVTKGFYDKYGPDRIKDTPIAENAIIGGAIGAALTVGVRGGGVLISLLVLPLYVPVLIFGAGAVDASAMGMDASGHLSILGALLLLGLGLAPWATAAALRISLE